MEIHHLCAALKQRVSVALLEASDREEMTEVVIAAFYELARTVLPLLGAPGRSREYLARQGAVLEMVTFLAMPLIRGGVEARRGVAVLAEIGEGCLDPLVKKKLTVYAHELLAKSGGRRVETPAGRGGTRLCWLLLPVAALLLVLYRYAPSAVPAAAPQGRASAASSLPEAGPSLPALPVEAPQPAPPRSDEVAVRGRGEETVGEEGGAGERPSPQARTEWITRVRIVNRQVLVPVTLKNGAENVTVQLVLDTGASRTVIHDALAVRLRIDPRLAKPAVSEVADGRVIRSRIARIDSLSVGPFLLAPAELELIAYTGADGVRDGLLGMDFLGLHRYQIDMERALIRWF